MLIAIALGLASRRYGASLPSFIAEYAGDTLWASALFFLLAVVLPKARTITLATLTLAGAYLIEVSQLVHWAWLDDLRATRVGGLLLGNGFVWTDLVCYAAGVALGCLADRFAGPAARDPDA